MSRPAANVAISVVVAAVAVAARTQQAPAALAAAPSFKSCGTFAFAYHLQARGVSCATARTVPPLTSPPTGQAKILLHNGSRLEVLFKLAGGWACKVLSYPGPGEDDRSGVDDCRLGTSKDVRWTDDQRVQPRSLWP